MRTVLRLARRLVGAAVVLVAVAVVAGGVYYSQQLIPAQGPYPITADVVSQNAGSGQLRLDTTAAEAFERDDVLTDGTFGFRHQDGYARISGAPSSVTENTAVRRFEVISGRPPANPTAGQVQAYAFPEDPSLVGDVILLDVPGPLGDHPAWYFPGEDDTIVVFVHGRGATRAEALRGVEIVRALGHPALVISHRNDGIGPQTQDGVGHYGGTEWEDLEAAVDYATDTLLARRVVVFAHSQGGSITAAYLRNGANTDRVDAVILDSPLLSLHATLVQQAENRDIPGPLITPILTVAKAIADVQGGIDFAAVEHVAAADDFDVPILLFHGRDDTAVPFAPSADFAERRPDLVEFVPYDGEHVRGWNVVNATYVGAVRDFLSTHG